MVCIFHFVNDFFQMVMIIKQPSAKCYKETILQKNEIWNGKKMKQTGFPNDLNAFHFLVFDLFNY